MEVLSGVPIAAGSIFDWIGTPVGQTWQAVQAIGNISDDDSSYLGSAASGNVGLVRCERPPGVESVSAAHWVTVLLRVRRTAIGGAQGIIAPRIHSGAAHFEGESVSLGTSYVDLDGRVRRNWLCELDPATGSPWTLEAAITAEVGLVDLTGVAHGLRCTTITKMIGVARGRGNATRYPH